MKLPLYKLKVSSNSKDELNMSAIALVDEPAIMTYFIKFNQQHEIKFHAIPERKLIMSPALIADMPIYRNDEKLGEHYVVFDKESIFLIVDNFFKSNKIQQFKLSHEGNVTDGVHFIESFIIDSTRGVIAPKIFENLSEGSWIITAKVDNDKIWQDIKDGKFKGFSIEGNFEHELFTEQEENILNEIASIVSGN